MSRTSFIFTFFLLLFAFHADSRAENALNSAINSAYEDSSTIGQGALQVDDDDDDDDIEILIVKEATTDQSVFSHKFCLLKVKPVVFYFSTGFSCTKDFKKQMKLSSESSPLTGIVYPLSSEETGFYQCLFYGARECVPSAAENSSLFSLHRSIRI